MFLSHSFRFGSQIAAHADQVIRYNFLRAHKHLKANDTKKPGFVKTIRLKSGYQIYKELAGQVVDLVKNKKVKPKEIIVLGRMFAQMHGLQAEFLAKKIPLKVLGNEPFYNRHEIKVLLGYLKVALGIKNSPQPGSD